MEGFDVAVMELLKQVCCSDSYLYKDWNGEGMIVLPYLVHAVVESHIMRNKHTRC